MIPPDDPDQSREEEFSSEYTISIHLFHLPKGAETLEGYKIPSSPDGRYHKEDRADRSARRLALPLFRPRLRSWKNFSLLQKQL